MKDQQRLGLDAARLHADVDGEDNRWPEQHGDERDAEDLNRHLRQVHPVPVDRAGRDDGEHAEERQHDLGDVLVAVEVGLDSAVQPQRRGEDGKRSARLRKPNTRTHATSGGGGAPSNARQGRSRSTGRSGNSRVRHNSRCGTMLRPSERRV